jgi:Tfp pilus assembly protein PilN
MIKVNLCPVEELESPYWYVPDLAVVITVAMAGYFGVQYYLGTIQEEVDKISQNIASLETSTKQLEPDLKRFQTLDQDVKKLNEKLIALQSITVSKIERIKPLIALEHLQNIKPIGVWYQSLEIGIGSPSSFKVAGQSFDNVRTAEFMMALRSTESQEVEPTDLRSQVYFTGLSLKAAELKKGEVLGFPDLRDLPSFEITGLYVDRFAAGTSNPSPSLDGKDVSRVEDEFSSPRNGRL